MRMTKGNSFRLTAATLLVSLISTSLVASASTTAPAPTALPAEVVNLGSQVTSTMLQGTTAAVAPDGKVLFCSVIRGYPARLNVIEAETGKLLHTLPLEGAEGSWTATTATDGSVYVGSDPNGHLYRYIPGESRLHDLGQVLGQSWVWDVVAGKDGEVFGSTFPHCLAFRYHPNDGFAEISNGPLADGEQYGRSLGYDAVNDKLFIGIGSHAHLIHLNPRTKEKTNVLPEEYRKKDFVYTVDVQGSVAIARPTPGDVSIVLDTTTLKQIGKLEMPVLQSVIKAPNSNVIYYSQDGKVFAWDPDHPETEPANVADVGADISAFAWKDGGQTTSALYGFNRHGNVYYIDLAATKPTVKSVKYKVEPSPTLFISIAPGPDGRVWVGGYLSGGASVYDPKTKKTQQFGHIGQPEEITTLNEKIFFACYPGAKLVVYDTTKPWDAKKQNPRVYADLQPEGQSRPRAVLAVPELNKVYAGTVADYGHLGGALNVYDVAADTSETFRNPVVDQSVVSLMYHKGFVLGGTSTMGGLGQKAAEGDGKLFLWDPATNKKVFEIAPVPGKSMVGDLFLGPDGNVWGHSRGTLFVFDVEKREVILRKELVADHPNTPGYRDGNFVLHPNGMLYASILKKLYRIDPKTFELTTIVDHGVQELVLGPDDTLYFRYADQYLCTYKP
jgi:hypothetical protein